MHLQLMMAPAVSGAKNYQELIIAAKNEEKRLADLKKRQAYARSIPHSSFPVQKPGTPSELHEASRGGSGSFQVLRPRSGCDQGCG